MSQKIVLFIEPNVGACYTPLKIGNLFINRFSVEEDAASEILKILELEKTSIKISDSDSEYNPEYKNFEKERKQKGMDLSL